MILISHRGNINGRNPKLENNPEYIMKAIEAGYDVEIDIREIDGKFYLGHDKPQYEISLHNAIFLSNPEKLWIHCKNILALHSLQKYKDLNIFFHDRDQCTLTSKGYIWTYPGCILGHQGKENNSICVLPETVDYEQFNCCGICSDEIEKYKK